MPRAIAHNWSPCFTAHKYIIRQHLNNSFTGYPQAFNTPWNHPNPITDKPLKLSVILLFLALTLLL